MKKLAVVTGGAGFIGSHLVERLFKEGHDVRVIDNFSTGRKENLKHLSNYPNLEIIEANICDLQKIKPVFKDAQWVFHMAALADIVPSIQEPMSYYRSNVEGTICVAEAAKEAQVERFIYTASSSCYGIPDSFPTPETAPTRPQYPYALTKLLGEQIIQHWGQVYGLPYISLRLFNVYGPRSRTNGTYGAVFGVFLAQKLANKPYTIVGDGNQTRDFTYVTDVVDAFVCAAQSRVSMKVFNVGSGNTYKVNRLVELLGGEKQYIPKRPGEPDCTFADITQIRAELGWTPRVSLETGVGHLLENIDYWRSAPVWTPETIASATKDWFKYLK